MTKIIKIDPANIDMELLSQAADVIKHGGLVAFPTETVYGLGADTFNSDAVANIFRAKGRPMDNPLISHISDIADLEMFAREIPPSAIKLAEEFWGGPLTLILKKKAGIPDCVTAGLDTVAVRLPSHSIANVLIKLSGTPIAAPSANLSGSPSPTTATHCIQDLDGRVDMIIDGGSSMIGIESTVIDLSTEVPVILRPGMISPEDMRSVIGEVVYAGEVEGAPKCPGMKYTHYSPNASVIVIEDVSDYKKHTRSGETVCVIAKNASDAGIAADIVYDAGNSDAEYAARLFYLLRKADEDGADVVFAQLPETSGIGIALRNRLFKSAGGRVIMK
ncbi:MAG: threonylcarbamoyl-AMP synthase [Ruminococcaceae bacterium]|nr:threonylcarbamoyl-AMP synthase [Oscillospiraceae bacterium]